MATKKFTLLELHLGDGTVQIGPATIGAEAEPTATGGEDGDGDGDGPDASDDAGGGCPARTAGKALLVAASLALVAILVRKLLAGGEPEEIGELEELEELADAEE
jgi:hypothetical protein